LTRGIAMKKQLRDKDAKNLVGLEILEAKDAGGSFALTLSNGSIFVIKSDFDVGLDYGRCPVTSVELNVWID